MCRWYTGRSYQNYFAGPSARSVSDPQQSLLLPAPLPLDPLPPKLYMLGGPGPPTKREHKLLPLKNTNFAKQKRMLFVSDIGADLPKDLGPWALGPPKPYMLGGSGPAPKKEQKIASLKKHQFC